jgi:IS30 family transposase
LNSDKTLTITADNGKEFAKHEHLASQLNADIYFAHPYSSWEPGLNENINGLIRQILYQRKSF